MYTNRDSRELSELSELNVLSKCKEQLPRKLNNPARGKQHKPGSHIQLSTNTKTSTKEVSKSCQRSSNQDGKRTPNNLSIGDIGVLPLIDTLYFTRLNQAT